MTAHNATCLPHIGVGIFRKVADAKFEVPLNTASPIPRKIQKQPQVQRNDVVMYMCPGNSSDGHDNFRSGFSCCVLSNLPQTTSNVTIVKPRTNCSCIHTCVYLYTHVLVKCIDATYFYEIRHMIYAYGPGLFPFIWANPKQKSPFI